MISNKVKLGLTAALTLLVVLALSSKTLHPTNDAQYSKTSVMVTRFDGRSGGTGVILSSNKTESKILTNAHVCGVVEHGGLVISDSKRATVSSYQVSELHDLCLITVHSDLGVNTEVASNSPDTYSPANVSGHPSLLPNIITKGHFSQKEIVTVMIGFRACEQKDIEGDNALLCLFLGGIPVIKTYEAQVVSSTIMPGSSGSAVFDRSGHIAGLVFAGSGELSYGLIVPQEYVYNFVTNEVPNLKVVTPSTMQEVSLSAQSRANLKTACKKLEQGNTKYEIVEKYCPYLIKDMIKE